MDSKCSSSLSLPFLNLFAKLSEPWAREGDTGGRCRRRCKWKRARRWWRAHDLPIWTSDNHSWRSCPWHRLDQTRGDKLIFHLPFAYICQVRWWCHLLLSTKCRPTYRQPSSMTNSTWQGRRSTDSPSGSRTNWSLMSSFFSLPAVVLTPEDSNRLWGVRAPVFVFRAPVFTYLAYSFRKFSLFFPFTGSKIHSELNRFGIPELTSVVGLFGSYVDSFFFSLVNVCALGFCGQQRSSRFEILVLWSNGTRMYRKLTKLMHRRTKRWTFLGNWTVPLALTKSCTTLPSRPANTQLPYYQGGRCAPSVIA